MRQQAARRSDLHYWELFSFPPLVMPCAVSLLAFCCLSASRVVETGSTISTPAQVKVRVPYPQGPKVWIRRRSLGGGRIGPLIDKNALA